MTSPKTFREALRERLSLYTSITDDAGVLEHAALHIWAVEDDILANDKRAEQAIAAALLSVFRALGTNSVPFRPQVFAGIVPVLAEFMVMTTPELGQERADALLQAALKFGGMMAVIDKMRVSRPAEEDKKQDAPNKGGQAALEEKETIHVPV